MEERKPKFEIGNIVVFKVNRETKFFITEILESTCSGGKQVSYAGRMWMKQLGDFSPANKSCLIQEEELEAL